MFPADKEYKRIRIVPLLECNFIVVLVIALFPVINLTERIKEIFLKLKKPYLLFVPSRSL